MAHTISSGDDFKTKVLQSDKPVIVDFFAEWCGPCQMMLPTVEEIGQEKEGQIVKVDIDQTPELAQEYGVMGVPTFIAFADGKEVGRHTGAVGKEELVGMLG